MGYPDERPRMRIRLLLFLFLLLSASAGARTITAYDGSSVTVPDDFTMMNEGGKPRFQYRCCKGDYQWMIDFQVEPLSDILSRYNKKNLDAKGYIKWMSEGRKVQKIDVAGAVGAYREQEKGGLIRVIAVTNTMHYELEFESKDGSPPAWFQQVADRVIASLKIKSVS